jgi:non-specific serine/threonine protein kinase
MGDTSEEQKGRRHPNMHSDAIEPRYLYRFGSVSFDEGRLELRVKQLPVGIEMRPLEVLSVLLRAGGRLVSKAELLDGVWSARPYVSDAVIPTAVGRLRRALTEENEAYIVTVHGKGYRFNVDHGTGVEQCMSVDLASGPACPICGFRRT